MKQRILPKLLLILRYLFVFIGKFGPEELRLQLPVVFLS